MNSWIRDVIKTNSVYKYSPDEKCKIIISIIEDNKLSINNTDKNTNLTPIEYAAVNGELKICDLLLQYGSLPTDFYKDQRKIAIIRTIKIKEKYKQYKFNSDEELEKNWENAKYWKNVGEQPFVQQNQYNGGITDEERQDYTTRCKIIEKELIKRNIYWRWRKSYFHHL